MAKRGVEIPITAEDMTRAAFNSAAQNAKRLDKQLQNTTASGRRLQGQSRSTRGALGQLGFQIQDVAVQLQSGQNAMLIFGQQGSQIASIFGPGGAVIGAILAVSAAIGTALLPKLFDATSAEEDLAESLEAVNAIAKITDGNILILSDAMATLARTSREAAGVQLAAGVIQAEAAVTASVGRIGEALEEQFGGFLEPAVQSAVDQFKQAADAGLGFTDVMRAGMVPATNETEMLRHTVGGLKDEIIDISQSMGISAEEAYGLVASYAALQDEASKENVDDFLEVVTALSPATAGASGELRGLQSELIVAQQAADGAVATLEKFKEAQASFAETGELPKTETESDIDTQNNDLYIEGLMERFAADRKYAEQSGQVWSEIVAARATSSRQIISIATMQAQQMAGLAEEGSAAGKAFFLVQQSLAAANAIISGLAAGPAIMESYAKLAAATGQPWLVAAGQAHAAGAKVMGFATAGAIMAQTVASFEGGGFTGLGPRSGGLDGKGGKLAIMHPNEKVIDLEGSPEDGGAPAGNMIVNITATDAKSFRQQLAQNRGYMYGMIDQYWRRHGRKGRNQ